MAKEDNSGWVWVLVGGIALWIYSRATSSDTSVGADVGNPTSVQTGGYPPCEAPSNTPPPISAAWAAAHPGWTWNGCDWMSPRQSTWLGPPTQVFADGAELRLSYGEDPNVTRPVAGCTWEVTDHFDNFAGPGSVVTWRLVCGTTTGGVKSRRVTVCPGEKLPAANPGMAWYPQTVNGIVDPTKCTDYVEEPYGTPHLD